MIYTKPLSYSGIKLFKKCPKLWEDSYILGNKQPSGPAAQRGTMLHDQLEKYYKGGKFPAHLTVFRAMEPELTQLMRYTPEAERELALTQEWNLVPFDDPAAYVRGKVDLCYWDGDTRVIIDWKSGREYAEHKDQGEFYFALDHHNTAKAKKTVVKMVYLDSKKTLSWEYTPDQLAPLMEAIDVDVRHIRNATAYDPTPSMETCRYCPLSWRNGGRCNAAP